MCLEHDTVPCRAATGAPAVMGDDGSSNASKLMSSSLAAVSFQQDLEAMEAELMSAFDVEPPVSEAQRRCDTEHALELEHAGVAQARARGLGPAAA